MSSSPSSPAAPTSSGVDPWSLTSQALRQHLLSRVEAVLPQLFALKLGRQRVKTVAFFVSQYWNDEADDAVHAELRYAFDVVTDPAALTRPDPYDDREHDDRMSFDDEFSGLLPDLDSNGEMIHAFASYACESSQDDLEYAPYCVWHQRPDGTFSSTIIGRSSCLTRSSVRVRHTSPRPHLAMKLMASGVTFSAAITRSPSFSRSSSSTRMTIRPLRMSSRPRCTRAAAPLR